MGRHQLSILIQKTGQTIKRDQSCHLQVVCWVKHMFWTLCYVPNPWGSGGGGGGERVCADPIGIRVCVASFQDGIF